MAQEHDPPRGTEHLRTLSIVPRCVPDAGALMAPAPLSDAYHIVVTDSIATIFFLQVPTYDPDLPGLRESVERMVASMRAGQEPQMPTFRVPAAAKVIVARDSLIRLRDLISQSLEPRQGSESAEKNTT